MMKKMLRARVLIGVFVLGAVIAVGVNCSRAGGQVTTKIGGVTVAAALEPDPPRATGNTLVLELEDAKGAPLDGADVGVTAVMPAMGAMAQMRSKARVERAGEGRYRAAFDLPMSGTWTLDVVVKSAAASGTAQLRLTVGAKGLSVVGMGGGAAMASRPTTTAPGAMSATEFSATGVSKLGAAFEAYESARALLARDTIEGMNAKASAAAAALRDVASSESALPGDVRGCIDSAAKEAESLASSTDVVAARRTFGELSRYLVALASADKRLQGGWHVFECPMAEGFKRWFQRAAEIENPYMGQKMPTCGTKAEWASAPTPAAGGDEVAYYTCSMHPSVKSETPGTCPICNMTLTPVTQQELDTGMLMIDDARRQQIGVKTARAERRPLMLDINTVARVTYDETRLHEVNLRIGGWVEELFVDEPGQRVKAGQTLFTLYSPELYAAQVEFIAADRATSEKGAGISETLGRAARKRLDLWSLTPQQIDALAATGEAQKNMPILSPADGYVIEKNVVAGTKVEPGMQVYRIADLDRVWIEADIFEADLPRIKVGQPAKITLPYAPGALYEGAVSFVYPYLDAASRTGRVRIELPNPKLELKPNMFANVAFEAALGDALQIPSEGVIYTGRRRLVFVDLGEGRLRPQEIEVGREGREFAEVTKGLNEGDIVVTSGNFLIAAESRIRSAAKFWHDDEGVGASPASSSARPSSMPTSAGPSSTPSAGPSSMPSYKTSAGPSSMPSSRTSAGPSSMPSSSAGPSSMPAEKGGAR